MYLHCFRWIAVVNCVWGEWTEGNCSLPCGGGYQINFREKLVSEMYGGECEGESETEEKCNTHECPGKIWIIDHSFEEAFIPTKHSTSMIFYWSWNLSWLRMERLAIWGVYQNLRRRNANQHPIKKNRRKLRWSLYWRINCKWGMQHPKLSWYGIFIILWCKAWI